MKKLLYIPCIAISVNLSGMDDENTPKKSPQKEASVPMELQKSSLRSSSPRIETLDQLKQIRQSGGKRDSPRQDIMVSPMVAAEVAATIAYKKDPCDTSAKTLKQLEFILQKLQNDNPHEYSRLEQGILILNEHYNNDISAQGIATHKTTKSKPSTPNSSSTTDSPKKNAIKALVKNQSTLMQEVHIKEKELEDLRVEASKFKKKFRKLTLQAAADAQKEEQRRADRNMYLGLSATVFATIGAAIITGLATYYGAIVTAQGSNSNSPHCINATL